MQLIRSVVRLASLTAISMLGAPLFAGVLTVGATSPDFSDIQSAVNAAIDGDVVLVRAGSDLGFTLDGKGIAIVADPEGSATITGTVAIVNVGAGKVSGLSGFNVLPSSASIAALQCNTDAGSIRIEAMNMVGNLTLAGSGLGGACRISGCTDVAFARCRFSGAASLSQYCQLTAGLGLQVTNGSRVPLEARRTLLGTIPPSGVLTAYLAIPDLGPGVQSLTRYMQAVRLDSNGQGWLTGQETVVLLDSAY